MLTQDIELNPPFALVSINSGTDHEDPSYLIAYPSVSIAIQKEELMHEIESILLPRLLSINFGLAQLPEVSALASGELNAALGINATINNIALNSIFIFRLTSHSFC